MQSNHSKIIILTDQHRKELKDIVRKRSSTQAFVLRANIILAAAKGTSLRASAKLLKCNRETVTLWRKHWIQRSDDLPTIERLKEAERPGAPPKFSAEQVCQIIAMSCDKPEDHGYIVPERKPPNIIGVKGSGGFFLSKFYQLTLDLVDNGPNSAILTQTSL